MNISSESVMEPFNDSLLLETFGRQTYDKLNSRGYATLTKCAELTEKELREMGIGYPESEGLLSTFTKGKGEEQVVRELLVSISNTELYLVQYFQLLLTSKPEMVHR